MFPLRKLRELPPKTGLRKIALILRGMETELARGKAPDRAYLRGLCELIAADYKDLAADRSAAAAGAEAAADYKDRSATAGRNTAADAEVAEDYKDRFATADRNTAADAGPADSGSVGAGFSDSSGLARAGIADSGALSPAELLRFINNLRHTILTHLGAAPAEWDFIDHTTGMLDAASRAVLPLRVYLEDIRSPYNVGSMFRTAEAFGAEHIYLSPQTPRPTHPRASKTARGCEKIVPWSVAPLRELARAPGVFALELGGTPLDEFVFPRQGTVLIGSEELGLSPEALALADGKAGRVSIPMAGAKRSLNVSAAFAVLMRKWYAALAGKSGE